MSLDGIGANLIRGTKTLLDVKTLSCKEAYAEERTGVAGTVVTKRQEEVNRQYHMRAREIDLPQGTAPGETGSLKNKPGEYGQGGRIFILQGIPQKHLRAPAPSLTPSPLLLLMTTAPTTLKAHRKPRQSSLSASTTLLDSQPTSAGPACSLTDTETWC